MISSCETLRGLFRLCLLAEKAYTKLLPGIRVLESSVLGCMAEGHHEETENDSNFL